MLDGNGIVGAGYLPPGYPQFFWKPSSSEALDYDPAQANQMLDDAGYKMGSNGVRVDAETASRWSSGSASTPTTRPTPRSRRTSRSG